MMYVMQKNYLNVLLPIKKKYGEHCTTLVDILSGLTKHFSNIGTDQNPFGAEISTLQKMKEEQAFDPEKDTVKLLYSGTRKGAFSAAILHNLLINVYELDSDRISGCCITELREDPADDNAAKEAEKKTQDHLLAARDDNFKNIYVMTGGFKSIIPTLTVCAITQGSPVFYLFERSKHLMRFTWPDAVKNTSLIGRFFSKKHDTVTENGIEYEKYVIKVPVGKPVTSEKSKEEQVG
ncbi:hypothetical protein GF312_03930 [Candidatus Poribacteria bacterium]|nr:hypothetical protein [Candidatus Poribacteria bacterium]